LGFSIDSAYGP